MPRLKKEPSPTGAELPPCLLDGQPIGSKVTILRFEDGTKFAHLIAEGGPRSVELRVEPDDVCQKLPTGAQVQRTAVDAYTAIQLNPTVGNPPLVCPTAREAIARFNVHFHGAKE